AGRSGFHDHGAGVVFGFTGVDHDGAIELASQRQLRRERTALRELRRMVVVVVEATLADSDGPTTNEISQCGVVARLVEICGVVRMYTGSEPHEAGMRRRQRRRPLSRGDRFADTDDTDRARGASVLDDGLAIFVERRIGEMGVAVEKGGHEKT